MESELLKYFLGQGAFGLLFVWLFMDTRKESKERERGYQATILENQTIIRENQATISKLTDKFDIVEDIKEDVEVIKNKLEGKE